MVTMPPAKNTSAPRRRWAGMGTVSVLAMGHRRQNPVCNLPRKAYARVAAAKRSVFKRSGDRFASRKRIKQGSGSETVLDPRIDHLGKRGEMRADEGARDGHDQENDDD